jgi:hypothetical protein
MEHCKLRTCRHSTAFLNAHSGTSYAFCCQRQNDLRGAKYPLLTGTAVSVQDIEKIGAIIEAAIAQRAEISEVLR